MKFKPLYLKFYSWAKDDGCIWVPFEETTTKKKKKDSTMYAEAAEEASNRERES